MHATVDAVRELWGKKLDDRRIRVSRIGSVATRLFYTICATRVDAMFSVQLSPSPTFTISLFLRLITDHNMNLLSKKSLLGLTNILNSHDCYLSTSPARRVYISCLKSSEMKRLRTALTYTCIIAPLLSEHGQGLGRIRSSVLIFVLAFIYIMRALVCSPHIPDFSRFLSACCTLLWVVDSDGNCIHRRKGQESKRW